MDILNLKARELAEGYRNRDFSVEEVTKEYFKNIKEKNGEINAYISLNEENALKEAKEVDEKFRNREELSKIAGIPISIKDNIAVKDLKMTCASKILENFVSPYDAEVVRKIKANDGIILGKVNLDEFAMGASTKTSYFGVTKNPLNTKLVSGGSSGGSAASVAGNMAAISLGTDTGGSVRQPSSFCGTVGMKPTYGTVSRFGVSSMANTFDQVGVIGKDVEDMQSLLSTIEGRDEKDATSVGNESLKDNFDFNNAENSLKGIKVAIPKIYLDMNLDKDIKGEFNKAIDILLENGAIVEEFNIESLKYVIETYHILVNGEIASNLARFDSVIYGHRAENFSNIEEMYRKSRREGFGNEVKRRIMIGTHILSLDLAEDYYYKALKVRGIIKRDMENMFKDYDLMLCPTYPVYPFEINREMSAVEIYVGDLFTIPANMAGCPSISIPMPKKENGLSVGMEFTAKRFKDRELINAAHAFERSLRWHIKQLWVLKST